MDKIDNNVLDDLEDRCYEKGYCQTWSEKMGLTRLSALLGLLCFLANVAWGVGCDPNPHYHWDYVLNQARDFADKNHGLNGDGDQSTYGPQFVLENHKAVVGGITYCGAVVRGYRPGNIIYNNGDRGTTAGLELSFMCFGFAKGTKWYKGSCLMLNADAPFSEIRMEFKKGAFLLHIREDSYECGRSISTYEATLSFKPHGDRYLLKAINGQLDDEEEDYPMDPIYRQKRDGKQIFMDKMDRDIIDDLLDRCVKKGYCQDR
ncbi:hypothetical protein [Helicobacter mehlei]|uniref:hypothetical protein n=1 Tax=Helicobacter mehlei TaxID=2316080 RepID=UPI001F2E131B|nr:hypothetical protein [Helicobacter mehlei]